MPSVTITLTDTPQGGVSIRHDFQPRVGSPCSPAQSTALEIIARTQRNWGLSEVKRPALVHEVDIDAVHRTRDNVLPGRIMSELESQQAIAKLKAIKLGSERGR